MEVTLLKEKQIFWKNKLKIFDKYETKAAITDFAILLGGFASNKYYYNNSNLLEDRTGYYWASSDDKFYNARVVSYYGFRSLDFVNGRLGGARPALPYSSISKISSSVMRGRDGILEVEYGEYPQKVASRILQIELESAYKYNQNSIRRTGKKYTTDSRRWNDFDKEFSVQEFEEFEYKGKRYVRVKANFCYNGSEFTLSNG